MTTTPTISAIATEARALFVNRTRDNGGSFWSYETETAPEWLGQMVRDAHGDMMPDDHRYAFIVEALDALAEYEYEDADDVYLEADIYTHELTAWLGSRADRFGYCDEAMEDSGASFPGTVELLQWGQAREKEEVLGSVRESIRARLEALESDDSDD